MAAPNWNPCLSAAQQFFAPATFCGCNCNASARLERRSAGGQLGPFGHAAFNFLNGETYRRLDSSTQYDSSKSPSPSNQTGSWSGTEQVSAVFDAWGNITYSGSRTRSWSRSHSFVYNGITMSSGQYSESATIDQHGCLQGSWQFNGIRSSNGLPYSDSGSVTGKQTVAARCAEAYDCPAGIGCSFPTVNITATQWTETWSCSGSPNARPGSYSHSRTLSEPVTAQDLINTLTSALPVITSLPWEAHGAIVRRRIGYSNSCEGASGDTMTTLQWELDALQQSAGDAGSVVTNYQQQLSDTQQALNDYLAEWETDKLAWQAEKLARCQGPGGMNGTQFAELEERVGDHPFYLNFYHRNVSDSKVGLADAQAVKAAADYFVTLKQTAMSAVNNRWQPMLEAGGGWPEGEVIDDLWVTVGRAQARVVVELEYPAKGAGETFRCVVAGQDFDITVAAGEYIAYGPPFSLTDWLSYVNSITNTTHVP